MSRDAEFRRELDKLYRTRSDFIRHYLSNKRGVRATLRGPRVERTIRRLQELETEAMAKPYARAWFSRCTKQKRRWSVSQRKGHTRRQKGRTFRRWYDERIGSRSCIYMLWNGKRCLYVGKTERGRGRPTSHFEKNWFAAVTRIDVYEVPRPRDLPTLECLAIHLHDPVKNRAKAASRKWTPKCPVCGERKEIRDEVRDVFRFR
jgi:hypothetical protein